MNIQFKYIVIIVLIIAFVICGLIWRISNLNSTIKEKEDAILILNQNEQSLKDEINMKADSIQDFAIRVFDLQNLNKDSEKKYTILKSKYKILIDSIQVLNRPATVDTSGNTIIITFNGRKGKIWYNGSTTYFKIKANSTYSINVGADPIEIRSELYFDDSSKIIRNKIYADSVLIDSAKTVIDSTIYLLIQGSTQQPICELDFFDRLGMILELNQSILKEDNIYKTDKVQLNIGVEYGFDLFTIYGRKDLLNPYAEFGLTFNPSLKQVWKAIF